MTAQYAFLFDAKFCSGCKACQAACKDKNNLPPGVLWRRVMEVSGGTWQQQGPAWKNTVIAYNISIACNHCVHPKCAGICPVDAYIVRADGIVILDESRCMGCGYCSWGCPYGAPQYDAQAGHMTKCDFCFENLEQGLPPVCVAACPLRVLDYRDMESLPSPLPLAGEQRLWELPSETHPYPLPVYSHTQPRLVIKQHAAMNTNVEKQLANTEEIRTRPPSSREDVPLILFTLLGQMSVGGLWAMIGMFPPIWAAVTQELRLLQLLPAILVGVCLGAGMLASLAHLGAKKNALHIFTNLRRSSLSREVLYTGLFGIGWLLTILVGVILQQSLYIWMALTGAAGVGLIYNMARVYRLPAAPGWNTWRTNAGFLTSALLLGVSAMAPVLIYESRITEITIPTRQWTAIDIIILGLLLGQLLLIHRRSSHDPIQAVRIGFILLGMILTAAGLFQTSLNTFWFKALIFLIILSEETLGRWIFYKSRL